MVNDELPDDLIGSPASDRHAEAEQLLASIVEQSEDAIITKTLDGSILTWNDAAERLYGYAAEEIVGKPISLLTPPGQTDDLPHILARIKGGESITHHETNRLRKDGRRIHVSLSISPLRNVQGRVVGVLTIARDITSRKLIEQDRDIAVNFLRLVNTSNGTRELIEMATGFFQELSGCESVGIRLRDGDDYPYYETRGFPPEFILAENSLCVRGENCEPVRDAGGNPVLQCMCGNVIGGRFDPKQPFFTPTGSFWTNSTTQLLAGTTEDDRQTRTRNRCNGEGYESVALIPLFSGNKRFGLLQLNDHRNGLFSSESIAFWERLAGYLAVAVAKSRAEDQLRESEERYRCLFNEMTEGFALHEILCDEHGKPCDYRFLDLNPAFERLTGLKRRDVIGKTVREVLPAEDPGWVGVYGAVALTGKPIHFDNYSAALDRHYDVLAYCPAPRQFAVLFTDTTDRKRAEEEKLEMERRFLHAQKLESLGILAGGIAHDFNNILAGLLGYADLAMMRLPPAEPAREDIEVIKQAVKRASELTRQMLAYSGKGKFLVEQLDLSQVVEDSKKMVAISVSKKATLTYDLAADLPAIAADAAQVYQVIMNLAINASEALDGQSGTITVATRATLCEAKELARMTLGENLPEGLYVCLEVADAGCGMDEQTLARIFDPFFTTKFTGRGLGLAAVHGIIRGHKGAIEVSSKPGKGTTFRIFLPASGLPIPTAPSEPAAAAGHNHGIVLVVDDEELIRAFARQIIERAGFSVLAAGSGHEAIRMFREHQDAVRCVLLDLTMPDMDGAETFGELRRIRADVRVILASGYSEETAIGQFADGRLAGFVQKPYELETLLAKIRQCMV
jgi:PAS domain S-box-containing protein